MLLVPVGAMSQAAGPVDADLIAAGRRIYRDGILPSDQALQGVGAAGVVLSGKQAACATCHRRSGYGSSEGPIEVRPITGTSLFGPAATMASAPAKGEGAGATAVVDRTDLAPAAAARMNADLLRAARSAAWAGVRPRPSYDDALLANAIREGVDVTGRPMNVSMPRFAIDDKALGALNAYLRTLSIRTSPGVADDAIHFATVIQPGIDPGKRQALLDVLQTFVRDRNASQRSELRREAAGMVKLKRTYREWVLHVWELTGPSETWTAQLEAFDSKQPVFALMSGLGQESWRPIHDFSERHELPCIMPQVDEPALAESDFYTVYLSKGITLEAQALAKFLHDEGGHGPVIQVFRRGGTGAAAADAFSDAWKAASGTAPLERVIEAQTDGAFWRRLSALTPGATFVLWLAPSDLLQANALTDAASPAKAIYLSSSLYPGPRSGVAADGGGRVRLVYPQELPAAREARLEVARRWFRGKGIALTDEKLQMNAYLAATVTGMAVAHSADTYSREYLIERMEHRLGTAVELSIYPHLSLGPGQRYASKGSYVVQVGGADDHELKPLSDWIVP